MEVDNSKALYFSGFRIIRYFLFQPLDTLKLKAKNVAKLSDRKEILKKYYIIFLFGVDVRLKNDIALFILAMYQDIRGTMNVLFSCSWKKKLTLEKNFPLNMFLDLFNFTKEIFKRKPVSFM